MDRRETDAATIGIARRTVLIAAIISAFVAGAVVLWVASSAIAAFGVGIVLATALDAGTRGLQRILPCRRQICLLLVILLGAAFIAAAAWWSGTTLIGQFNDFVFSLKTLLNQARSMAQDSKLLPHNEGLRAILPSPSTLLGGATTMVPRAFNAASMLFAILFIAPFLAWEPAVYKAIVLSVIPQDKRERVDEVLDGAAFSMRRWLLGQSISMAVIFLFSLVALLAMGMPYAILLSVMAGLLTFIPTLGPFVSGIVIMLAGLSQSPTMALYGLLAYLAIQFLESNLITPVVQEHTVKLPPAATLALQLVAGLLFGLLGVAFIVPLTAAAKHIIQELYVNDCLGGGWSTEGQSGRTWAGRLIDRWLTGSGSGSGSGEG